MVGEQGDGARAAARSGVLVAVHGGADRAEAGERVGVADRELYQIAGEPVALWVGGARPAPGDRDQGAGCDAVAAVAAFVEPAAQGAGDDGDEDVVDGASGALADAVHVVEVDDGARGAAGAGRLRGQGGAGAGLERGADHGGGDVEGAARSGDRVAHQAGQSPHVGQQAARRFRGAGPGGGQIHGVEDGGGEGEGAQSVGEGVVELEQHGERHAVGAGQDVRLPRRAPPVQRALHQPARHGVEVVGRSVQPDVVERVEGGVGFAGGSAEGGRKARREGERPPDVTDAHAQAGHGGGAGGEQVGRVGARGGRVRGEDAERAQMHGVAVGLDVPERQVEWSQQIGRHGLASRRRRVDQQSSAGDRSRSSTTRLHSVNNGLRPAPTGGVRKGRDAWGD